VKSAVDQQLKAYKKLVNVIKLVPEQSVLKLHISDRIRLSADQFDRLSNAFLREVEAKFL